MKTTTRAAAPTAAWKSRIVGHGEEAPEQLLANPKNWRTHGAAQRDALRGSLDTVGWVAPLMINRRTGFVVDGHARIEEALSRGEPTVPVLYVDLSPEEEALVLATFDPIGAMAESSSERLAELLAEVTVDDEGLRRLLTELRPPRPGLTDPDEVPEPSAEPYVKAGDLWALGDHRILCGDATNADDVARLLDGAEPTLLATDPPYGVSLDPTWRDEAGYSWMAPSAKPYMVRRRKMEGDGQAGPRTAGHRNVTISEDTRADWSAAFALVPSLHVGYVWHADIHSAEVAQGLIAIGFELVCQVIWDKGQFTMGRSWYHWEHEPCWVVRKPGVPNLFGGERDQSTVWRVVSPKKIHAHSEEEKFDHPTQKPVLLFETPIRNHLGADEAVYDPFVGSGTTIIAAETLGRRCYAMEIEPKFVQMALERWQAFSGQKAARIDG